MQQVTTLRERIHIWRLTLDQPSAQVLELFNTLAEDERARAERFCFEKDRRHFIVARGLLRQILSGYVGVEPRDIRFGYGDNGKPFLRNDIPTNLRFNLSHSDGLAVLAVTAGAEIGVDFEVIQPGRDMDCIANQFFSASEYAVLQNIPAANALETFYNCWTRKEAFLKALGSGLSTPLDNFDVPLEPPWALFHWKPTTNSVAALVVSAIPHEIVFQEACPEKRRWCSNSFPQEPRLV
jgi:4'-phosphopantetheinyl transferase